MFDARSIKALSAGEHLTSDEHPGLRLEAFTDRHTWTYRYRNAEGKLKQIKIGKWPAMSVHAAVVAWEGLRAVREAGGDPAADKRAARELAREAAAAKAAAKAAADSVYRIRDLCDDYVREHVAAHRKPKGVREVARLFDTLLGESALLPAAELTRAQAFAAISAHVDRAPVLAANVKAELGSAWDWAIDSGRLDGHAVNWWRLILRRKIKSKGRILQGVRQGVQKRVLTPDEVGRLILFLPNFTRLVEDVLTLYLWTGCRGAEITGILGSEVTCDAAGQWWLTIPKHRTKNARHELATDLRVPLFGRALRVIRSRMADYGDGVLFPARVGGPVQQKVIGVAVWYHMPYSTVRPKTVRPALPVTHWAPHDLRRTVRTLLAMLGCPDEVAEAVLGHMPAGIRGVYNRHSYDAERVEWLGRLDEYLEGLVG